MSTTVPQPATTPIPVQLSEPEFEAFILPHLSLPKRGRKRHCQVNEKSLSFMQRLALLLFLPSEDSPLMRAPSVSWSENN